MGSFEAPSCDAVEHANSNLECEWNQGRNSKGPG